VTEGVGVVCWTVGGSHRSHIEIHVALNNSEHCCATLLTVNWEQMAHDNDNYYLLLINHKETPINELHCLLYIVYKSTS
jgi:hypothetical protein